MACESEQFGRLVEKHSRFVVWVPKNEKISIMAAEHFTIRFCSEVLSGKAYEASALIAQEKVRETFDHCDCHNH